MKIVKLNKNNIPIVSRIIAKIKPEFWTIEGAIEQLSSVIGWYFGPSKVQPKGWILCKSIDAYKSGEIECLGYDYNGSFKVGSELQPLMDAAEV